MLKSLPFNNIRNDVIIHSNAKTKTRSLKLKSKSLIKKNYCSKTPDKRDQMNQMEQLEKKISVLENDLKLFKSNYDQVSETDAFFNTGTKKRYGLLTTIVNRKYGLFFLFCVTIIICL